jgi:hypothetical protein
MFNLSGLSIVLLLSLNKSFNIQFSVIFRAMLHVSTYILYHHNTTYQLFTLVKCHDIFFFQWPSIWGHLAHEESCIPVQFFVLAQVIMCCSFSVIQGARVERYLRTQATLPPMSWHVLNYYSSSSETIHITCTITIYMMLQSHSKTIWHPNDTALTTLLG